MKTIYRNPPTQHSIMRPFKIGREYFILIGKSCQEVDELQFEFGIPDEVKVEPRNPNYTRALKRNFKAWKNR